MYARGHAARRCARLLRLRRAAAGGLAGAALMGLRRWMVVNLLAQWVLPPPKYIEASAPCCSPRRAGAAWS